MWLDILLTNRSAMAQLINIARQQLDDFADAIATGDEESLRVMMEKAAGQRRKMYRSAIEINETGAKNVMRKT